MMSLTEKIVLGRSKAKSLDAVRHLNLWGHQLTDISIISNLPNLEVLNLSCNNIKSLKDLKSCHRLTELYFRRNQLESYDELQYLSQLENLKILWLSDNPISKNSDYRSAVEKLLPQVTKLDNVDLHSEGSRGNDAILQAILLLLGQLDRDDDLLTVQGKVRHLLKK